jgi:hypothetical protein
MQHDRSGRILLLLFRMRWSARPAKETFAAFAATKLLRTAAPAGHVSPKVATGAVATRMAEHVWTFHEAAQLGVGGSCSHQDSLRVATVLVE